MLWFPGLPGLHIERKCPFQEFCVLEKEDFGGNYFATFSYRIWRMFCSRVRDHQLLHALYALVTMRCKRLVYSLLMISPQKL